MTEYHWNESPNDLMNLLDTQTSLPFDSVPDFFAIDQHSPIDTLFDPSLPVPAGTAGAGAGAGAVPTVDASTPPSILDVPNFEAVEHHSHPQLPITDIHLPATTIKSDTTTHVPVPTAPPTESHFTVNNLTTPSENGSEHDNSAVPQPAAPSTPGASSETLPGGGPSNSISSAASDVTAGMSAVDMARRAAENFANCKVSERKRRMGRCDDADEEDAKRRKGHDGSPCSDGGDDDAPEKVSHRKYQKRLQKNRDSAYVSRIRRREYTKRLEDGLNRMEKEKNEVQSKYEALQRKFDVVVQELKTMKEATTAKFKSIARPVGAAGRSATKKTSAGAIFMCIILFGLCLPGTSPWRTDVSSVMPSMAKSSNGKENVRFVKDSVKKGRVWSGMKPLPPPPHWGCTGISNEQGLMNSIANNVTLVFGPENGGEMVRLLKSRQIGVDVLSEVKQKAEMLATNKDNEQVKKSLPGRSKLLRVVLKKLASVADECFTKELIALLTIRILPNEGLVKMPK